MIPLRLRSHCDASLPPFVVRISDGPLQNDADAALLTREPGILNYRTKDIDFGIRDVEPAEILGDVLLVDPRRQIAHRLIRASSAHNTLLITEQCDQLCLMCSQPPKPHHEDMFGHFLSAALLAPARAEIGLSGGEPLLHKTGLFGFLDAALAVRNDLRFHILTNGQHFEPSDLPWLRHHRSRILWGVPIYSATAQVHDKIVGKSGAFERLSLNLALLGLAGASLELRTVIMRQNEPDLPDLADFICRHLPFATTWAIMQMERIGYGRLNWDSCFFDNSTSFVRLGAAIDMMQARRQNTELYNFPLCTVPEPYQSLAMQSISDWKRKYLSVCTSCSVRPICGGFFEWYREDDGFMEIRPQ